MRVGLTTPDALRAHWAYPAMQANAAFASEMCAGWYGYAGGLDTAVCGALGPTDALKAVTRTRLAAAQCLSLKLGRVS